jgi:hypothetical protein
VIEPPRRSVTRFFVPLIDVLTLLFCIFLVMPLAKDAREESARTDPRVLEERLKQAEAESRRLREENERLRRGRAADLAGQVSVGVLNLVPDNKPLLYYTTGQRRVDLRGPDDVRRMVENDRRQTGGKPWVYVIRYPSDPNQEPTEGQRREVFSWFAGLARVDVEGHQKQ